MTTLMIPVDGQAEEALQEMSSQRGIDPTEMAARLLKRAIRAARPKPTYDIPAFKAAYAEFAEEDVALAESDLEHRYQLLLDEDRA